MTATLDAVASKNKPEPTAEQRPAAELVRRAREQGWPTKAGAKVSSRNELVASNLLEVLMAGCRGGASDHA